MTLGDFFALLNQNPEIVLFYFIAVPLTALLSWILGRGDGNQSPWKYLYTFIIYATSIPAIFSITLSIYYFLFEQRSILDTDIITQVLPLLSMWLTVFLVKKNVDLDDVPGFEKLGGLVTIIAVALILLWIIDSIRLVAFTYIPFTYVFMILIALILALRYGWRRLAS